MHLNVQKNDKFLAFLVILYYICTNLAYIRVNTSVYALQVALWNWQIVLWDCARHRGSKKAPF